MVLYQFTDRQQHHTKICGIDTVKKQDLGKNKLQNANELTNQSQPALLMRTHLLQVHILTPNIQSFLSSLSLEKESTECKYKILRRFLEC